MKIPLSNPFKRYSQKVGLPPGTLVYTGEERTDPVRITLIDYDETHLHEEEAQTIEACLPFMDTTVSTFFIPLTFIAGIYGMNFRFMPELEVRWGYPVVLLVMAGIGIAMFVYFKLRKWL